MVGLPLLGGVELGGVELGGVGLEGSGSVVGGVNASAAMEKNALVTAAPDIRAISLRFIKIPFFLSFLVLLNLS